MRKWMRDFSGPVLSEKGREDFSDLLKFLEPRDDAQLSPDNLRNWLAHRDFVLTEDSVIYNFHPSPGKRFTLPKTSIHSLRLEYLEITALLLCLNTMFTSLIHHQLGIPPSKTSVFEFKHQGNK
jgi:hypothetical protein